MEWTKENLAKLMFLKFGITLTNEELDLEWSNVLSKTITPRGDKMNIAFSPLWLKTHIEQELSRENLSIKDSRFKKVREEIIPAIDYVLFLKKIGFGEFFICSSDSPDIVLINKNNNSVPGKAYKKSAVPIEVTFINNHSIENIIANDYAEKIVQVLEKNKLMKQYSPETMLLVVIDIIFEDLKIEKLANLLKNKVNNFSAICLLITENEKDTVFANIYPEIKTYSFNVEKDLDPLIF